MCYFVKSCDSNASTLHDYIYKLYAQRVHDLHINLYRFETKIKVPLLVCITFKLLTPSCLAVAKINYLIRYSYICIVIHLINIELITITFIFFNHTFTETPTTFF